MPQETHPPDEAIRVGVRLRPLVAHEKGQKHCFRLKDNEIHVIPTAVDAKDIKENSWRFDCSMDSSEKAGEEFVCNDTCYQRMGRNIIDHALEGYNACLFCYGQTGTGKTTTILGDQSSGPGLLILLLRDLFDEVKLEEQRGGKITVSVQMFEVYNEKVFDLLANPCSPNSQAPRKSAVGSAAAGVIELHVLPSGVQIKGAETKSVTTVSEVMRFIDEGNNMKHIAATAMNAHSSRGHTVFKLNIQKAEGDIHLSSEVYFADLAGHENEKTTKVTGDRMVELSYINKSLMWLQSAIHTLSTTHGKHGTAKNSTRTSLFRNSKLTLLLANALTGNSLINVIVTISPAAAHFPTSLSSLRFANEVKHMAVEVHSSANMDPAAVIKKLEEEVTALKEQLRVASAGGASPTGKPNRSRSSGSSLSHHSRSSATSASRRSKSAEKVSLDEAMSSLQEQVKTLSFANNSLEKELRDAQASVSSLTQELEDSRKRQQSLVLEQRTPNGDIDELASSSQKASPDPKFQVGNREEFVFSTDVAKSLAAITMKMNEMQRDLRASSLHEERDEITDLLSRARQLVPLPPLDEIRLRASDEPRNVTPARTPPAPIVVSDFRTVPMQTSPQRSNNRSASPSEVSPRLVKTIVSPPSRTARSAVVPLARPFSPGPSRAQCVSQINAAQGEHQMAIPMVAPRMALNGSAYAPVSRVPNVVSQAAHMFGPNSMASGLGPAIG